MGYYTDYTLKARKVRSKAQFESLVQTLKDRDIINYAIDEGRYDEDHHEAEFMCIEAVRWYNHSEDMVAVAEKYPNIYFELEGNGEEFGDFWKEYYHDMDIELCRGYIVYEEPKKVQWKELIPF